MTGCICRHHVVGDPADLVMRTQGAEREVQALSAQRNRAKECET